MVRAPLSCDNRVEAPYRSMPCLLRTPDAAKLSGVSHRRFPVRSCRISATALLSEYTLASAAIARAFTSYTGSLISGDANALRIDPGSKYFLIDLPALLLIVGICAILAIGTQSGAHFNTTVTIGNLLVILFVLSTGLPHFQASHFVPFMPMGLQGAFSGASKVGDPQPAAV
jgi:amino acid transporter